MVLWLSKDLGFSDQTAAALVVWRFDLVTTVFTLLVGSLTDPVGIRRTLFLCATVCLFAGAIMLFLTMKWLGPCRRSRRERIMTDRVFAATPRVGQPDFTVRCSAANARQKHVPTI